MTRYAATAARALATITKKGSVVTVRGGSPRIYDPATDTFSGGSATTVGLRAVQIENDPAQFAALGLVVTNPVTLLVAASGATVTPAPGMAMSWGGVAYTIKSVEAIEPDGETPILWTVVGDT